MTTCDAAPPTPGPACVALAAEIVDVPGLSDVTRAILALLDDPNAGPDQLALAITRDQSLSAKLLKIANSSLYGFQGRVDTIGRAIFVLGLGAVQSLALSLAVVPLFTDRAPLAGFDVRRLWEHSLGVGVTARRLLLQTDRIDADRAMLIGVLHDLGQLLECRYRPVLFYQAIDAYAREGGSLVGFEREFIDTDHCELADAVTARWGFPEGIRAPLRDHHADLETLGQSDGLIAVTVAAADLIVTDLGIGFSDVSPAPERLAALTALLPSVSIDRDRLQRRIASAIASTFGHRAAG